MAAASSSSAPQLTAVDFDPFAEPELQSIVFATESQQELWMAVRMGRDASLAFNESSSLLLTGPLDLGALQQAVQALVARHEALRLTLSADGQQCCIAAPQELALPCTDLSAFDAVERARREQDILVREVETPFVLEHGPLFRFQVLRMSVEVHRFVFTAHHIVCDGWSMGVALTELASLYRAFRGQTVPALGLAFSFATYAQELADYRRSEERSADERWWLSHLAGELPVLELPMDRQRPPAKTYASAREDLRLDAALLARCRKAGTGQGASLFATLLATFDVLLHRLAGQDEVVVAIPFAGQAHSGHHALIGHCVNTLPVRARLSSAQPFAALLSTVRDSLLDATEHQRFAFGSLLQRLALPRDPSRLPLASVLFNLDRSLAGAALDWGDVRGVFSSTPRNYENFDLFVNAVEQTDGGLVLECQYNSDLLSAATVRRWMACYALLLDGLAQDVQTPVGQLPLMPDEDRALIAGWNRTAAEFPRERLVHQLFAERRAATPDAVALEFANQQMIYAELDVRADVVAERLQALGVTADERVGLYLERGPWMVAAVLGVLKAGGAYVPLDPTFPADRLSYMVEDAHLRVVVTQASLRATLPVSAAQVLDVESLPSQCGRVAVCTATPEQCAYVIYTSGSTGKPKGVEVPHRAVVNLLTSMARFPGLSASDAVLAVTTLSFDIAGLELFLPLSVGARIVLAGKAQVADGAALLALIAARRVTMMQATPSTWRLLLSAGWQGDATFKALVGGEAVPLALARDLAARCGGGAFNMYGPTETTIWSTCERFSRDLTHVSIGRPIANTTVQVLDARLQPVPIGVPGELFIGGAGVARGYLGRPDLTQERFLPDVSDMGSRIYRTGDVVRFLADGTLEYLRRSDTQVKVRGYRIELGEIETVLRTHPQVADAAVLVREVKAQDVRLVAYVVARSVPDRSFDDGLRSHCRLSLPDYMVPQHVQVVTVMPLTPNGKLDRKALPPLNLAGTADDTFVAPRTPTEKILASLWQTALGVPRVSIHDDFFKLGGHSLLVAQVLSRLAAEHGLGLEIRAFFESPSIAVLAERLNRQGGRPVEHIPRRAEATSAPLSLMQQRLWFLEQLDPGEAVYHLPAAYRLSGAIDAAAFQRALDALTERHAVLRTSFAALDDGFVQVVAQSASMALPLVDLSRFPAAERERELVERMRSAIATPLDLSQAPLVRACLFRLADDAHIFFFMPHHIIWDGWSFDVFIRDLDQLYAASVARRPSPLAPLPIQYGDFAAWHGEWLKSVALAQQSAYWKSALAGDLVPLEMPTDHPRPAQLGSRGGFVPLALNAAEMMALQEVARRHDTTIYVVLLSAFKALLHRYTGQEDLLIGTPVRGRSWPETEDLIGFFVNTLVLRSSVTSGDTFSTLLTQVKRTVVDALAHPDMPFDLLVKELNVPRDLSRSPIYQAFFSFQDATARSSAFGDLTYQQMHVMPEATATELGLWLMERPEGLVGGLIYSAELFATDSMERFLRHFRTLLTSIVVDSTAEIGRLGMLPDAERRQQTEWNRTGCAIPAGMRAHQPFEQQAVATPDAVAITAGATQLTYRELDGRANQLAQRLRQTGFAPGSLIGLHLPRGPELVVGLLGILKAGSAYVPLDPAFPADRVAYMIEDSRVRCIVTTQVLAEALPPHQAVIIDMATLPTDACPAPDCPATSADPAYVIYTSGSSGRPKGVAVSHGNVVNFLSSMRTLPGLSASDVLLAVTTLSFDIAVLELYLPLWVGARIVLAQGDEVGDGSALVGLIRQHGVTVMQATPSTWHLLLDAGFSGGPSFKALVGGEAVPRELAQVLRSRCGNVFNMYGPTETTVWSTVYAFPSDVARVLIGRPIANTTTWVLDARRQPVPIGVPGELYLGGAGVALGYLNRSELTAERFVQDDVLGERLYRTGDVVRLLADGNLEYLRRNDTQVKVRGYRIELGEIETALGMHPAVARAIVVVHEVRAGDVRLVAYTTARPGQRFTEGELRKQLLRTLPVYMVPQYFIELDEFPLTPNGKIDRKRLPEVQADERPTESHVAPGTANEIRLAALWCDVLRVQRVGLHDNFFNLGGHSLLALSLIARIEREFAAKLSPRLLLLNTLAQVAAQLPDVATAPDPVPAPQTPTPSLLGRLVQGIKARIS